MDKDLKFEDEAIIHFLCTNMQKKGYLLWDSTSQAWSLG
jgi:hypothetical protein